MRIELCKILLYPTVEQFIMESDLGLVVLLQKNSMYYDFMSSKRQNVRFRDLSFHISFYIVELVVLGLFTPWYTEL